MPHHLEPVPPWEGEDATDPWEAEDATDPWEAEDVSGPDVAEPDGPLGRPTWWRWVAIALIAALVLAGPIAYVVDRFLR